MERVEQYGLQWTIQESPSNYVYLIQGNGLIFYGVDYVNIFWGPCIEISAPCLHTSDKRIQTYSLPEKQWFFTSYCRYPKELQWYNKLQNGFKFSKKAFKERKAFKLQHKYWRMSLTTAIGSKEDAQTVAKLLGNIQQFSMLYPNMYLEYSKGYPFLYVNDNVYNKLPDVWTISDLYNLDKEHYDSYKKKREYLWYSIAEARAQHKPIKIVIYDYNKKICIYTEQRVHGVAMPTVLTHEEERYR